MNASVEANPTVSPTPTLEPTPPSPRSMLGSALGFALMLLVAEVALLAFCYHFRLPFILGFIGHVSFLAIAALSVHRFDPAGGGRTPYYLTVLATLSTGVAGAALSLIALVVLSRQRDDVAKLEAWYDRISQAADVSPITRLTTSIAMGRAVDTDRAMPVSFEQVINSGSLADQQSALGLIARRFSPEYAPALRAALVSSEPVIRVQAAAVAVKVRGEAASALERAIAQAQAPSLGVPEARELAVRIDALIGSQLLEDFDRARGADVRAQLLTRLVDADPFQGLDGALPTDVAARDLIETQLLRQGRFAQLRAARLAQGPRA
jgi:hypothetical protein